MELIHLIKILTMACVMQYHTTKACYQTNSTAECSDHGLAKLPTNLNLAISRLDLSNNPITDLGPTDLETYSELEILLFSECGLKVLPEAIFKNLRKLIVLDLARNKLSSIPSNIFEHNQNLTVVVLDENGPFILNKPILISDSVETLSISSCGIEYLYDETFSSMPNLKELDVTRNPLQRITPNAFKTNTLKKLWIDSANFLEPVAHKLCSDQVAIIVDDDSMFDQLCRTSSTSTSPSTQKMFPENISTKLPELTSSEDVVFRVGKTDVYIIIGLIAVVLVILFTYRFMHKRCKERGTEVQRHQNYDYMSPHYSKIDYDSIGVVTYDTLASNNFPVITPPPLPPRPKINQT